MLLEAVRIERHLAASDFGRQPSPTHGGGLTPDVCSRFSVSGLFGHELIVVGS